MKTDSLSLLAGIVLLATSFQVWGRDVTVSGVVRDKSSNKIIDRVSLIVNGTDIGTVSNDEGYFSLTFPDSLLTKGIRAEQIGYKTHSLSGGQLTSGPVTFRLQPNPKMLEDVVVYGADPKALVETAIRKIPQNYSVVPNLFSSFYRETIQKGKRYIGVSEGIVDVFKKPYKHRNIMGDRVRLRKGRRQVSQRNSDTIAVKILGGPNIPVLLDFVKNEELLFGLADLDNYNFKMEPMAMLDDRRQFVVSFSPKVKMDYPLHKGKLYIDQETTSFTKAEYSLDVSDKEKATRAILYKKPRGLHFKPQDVDFVVTYKFQDGVSYLNYISARTRFKCDWKRRLFSSGYTAFSEMVMVDREECPATAISAREAFRDRDIFYDMVDDFSDPDFWKDYNIIELTESLEKAVAKLKN